MMKERVYSVLVVSSSEKFNNVFSEFLSGPLFTEIRYCSDISRAKRAVTEHDYDIIIVNSPVRDDPGSRFAIDAAVKTAAVVLFVTEKEFYEDNLSIMTGYGVFLLTKPAPRSMLESSITWLCAARERLKGSQKRVSTVEEKMEEIRLINRAKWVLISDRGMTEQEAHRMIEKEAMDRAVTKKVIAEEIIYRITR